MTVNQIVEKLNINVIINNGLDNEITGCYIGDFLSYAMSKAKKGDIWVTVMGNINTLAVASLVDVACILICDDAVIDNNLIDKAKYLNVPLLSSEKSAYKLACEIKDILC